MPSLYFPTLADIRARVRTYIDEAVQANFTDTEINYAINDSQQEVATEIAQVDEKYFVNPTATTITVVPLQQLYSLPTDFWKMVRMELQTTGEQVPFIDVNEKSIDNAAIPPLVSNEGYGAGLQAYILGNDVGFTPPPTDPSMIFQYWYVPIVPDLTSDTDVSVIPRQFMDLLAIQAAIDMLIKDEDDSSQLERKYARKLDQLKRTTRQRQVQNPKYVQRRDYVQPNYPWLSI